MSYLGFNKINVLFFRVWEFIYKNLIRARYIPGSKLKLLRVSYRLFRGREIQLPERLIRKGDLVCELHLCNFAIAKYYHHKRPEWAIYNDLLLEYAFLAADLEQNNQDIKALWAITLFGIPSKRMGFTLRPLTKGVWARFNNFWLRMLRKIRVCFWDRNEHVQEHLIESRDNYVNNIEEGDSSMNVEVPI